MNRKPPITAEEAARAIIKKRGGVIRTAEAVKSGIHPRTLYSMRSKGTLELISRGFYKLAAFPELANPDLVSVSLRAPKSVICLISALSFHGITTQIPHSVDIAVEEGKHIPKITYPPTTVFKFSKEAFIAGVESFDIDGVTVRVYNPEKTLADCFKFRNRIGMDVVLEALKLYKQNMKFKVSELLKYGRICRVEKIMRPYLETLL